MEKQDKKHSIAAFVILIIFILIIGVGVWWYLTIYVQGSSYKSLLKWGKNSTITEETTTETTTDETANWKTYENSKYGFSLKYPSGWSVNDSNPVITNAVPAPNPSIILKGVGGVEFRIYVLSNGVGGWGTPCLKASVSYEGKLDNGTIQITNRNGNISNLDPGSGCSTIEGFSIGTWFVDANNQYIFDMTGNNGDEWSQAEEVFKKIISLTKFN